MQYTTFGGTGLKVSRLGLGGAPLGGDYKATDDKTVTEVVHAALDGGVNVIDTAPLYGFPNLGLSEQRIGRALKEDNKRKDIILATKTDQVNSPFSKESILACFERSLINLQTDYVDLLQIHDAEQYGEKLVEDEILPAVMQLKEQGRARFIGITTCDLPLLAKYMRTNLYDSVQFYARYMLIDHTAKDEVLPLSRQLGIGTINGSVLGLGILADSPFRELGEDVLARARERMKQLDFLRTNEPKGLIEPAMRFSLGNPDIDITLMGTSSVNSVRKNISYCDGNGLPAEQVEIIHRLFEGKPLL